MTTQSLFLWPSIQSIDWRESCSRDWIRRKCEGLVIQSRELCLIAFDYYVPKREEGFAIPTPTSGPPPFNLRYTWNWRGDHYRLKNVENMEKLNLIFSPSSSIVSSAWFILVQQLREDDDDDDNDVLGQPKKGRWGIQVTFTFVGGERGTAKICSIDLNAFNVWKVTSSTSRFSPSLQESTNSPRFIRNRKCESTIFEILTVGLTLPGSSANE